ncbi:MAG TPA: type II toxin-antitoxin system RelE/ParE family toxin [Pyrinomonadaceae bacterium]|nr:type II toxin-antitoxin system RelE/ParE family toxin [Pyrinomonadaceae bacterium]
MPYLITRKALADINEIWLYTAENWSIEQADRYYNLIFDEIEFIAKNFDLARDMGWLREGYRASKVKSHIVFFRKTLNGEVEVVRVLHERMDLPDRLND